MTINKTYIQEKLSGNPGQIVKMISKGNGKYEAIVTNASVDSSKQIILRVNAPDNNSKIIVTNGKYTLQSDSFYVEYIPNESNNLITSENDYFFTSSELTKTFYLPALGTWIVTATKGGISTQTSIDITTIGQTYEVSLSYFNAYIDVTYPYGAICTCTNGIVTLRAEDSDGNYRFCVNSEGNWIIEAVSENLSSKAADVVTISYPEEIVSINVDYISTILNNNTWEVIHEVVSKGLASTYWSLGDCKALDLDGTNDYFSFNNERFYAEIIGFDHNTAIESNSRPTLTFQIGKKNVTNFISGQNNGTEVGIYDESKFVMNTTAINTGGWASSHMRTIILESLIEDNILPQDLNDYIISVTKYTSTSSGTDDKLFLLSSYEITGNSSNLPTGGTQNQSIYQYYNETSPSIVRSYYDSSSFNSAPYWTRSISSETGKFIAIDDSGTIISDNANESKMITFAFVVG